jgi:hypothetical protein
MSLSEIQSKAIKKSSLAMNSSELVINSADLRTRPEKPESTDRPSKFLKLEKNEKNSRVKKPEKPEETRLSTLVKMREKFNHNKSSTSQKPPIPLLSSSAGSSLVPVDITAQSLYQFSEPLQRLTGLKTAETLGVLESSLRVYLRNNSKVLFNSYDFSENEELCEAFGRKQLKYLEISTFVQLNSNLIN